jgi:hypothetical protein
VATGDQLKALSAAHNPLAGETSTPAGASQH